MCCFPAVTTSECQDQEVRKKQQGLVSEDGPTAILNCGSRGKGEQKTAKLTEQNTALAHKSISWPLIGTMMAIPLHRTTPRQARSCSTPPPPSTPGFPHRDRGVTPPRLRHCGHTRSA